MWPFRIDSSSMPSALGAGFPALRSCSRRYCFSRSGDSVINSVGDILMAAIGYFLAARLPVRASVALLILVEGALLLSIRDSLLLNSSLGLPYPRHSALAIGTVSACPSSPAEKGRILVAHPAPSCAPNSAVRSARLQPHPRLGDRSATERTPPQPIWVVPRNATGRLRSASGS